MNQNVVKFLKENNKIYMEFLKKIKTYPSVCDYSSMILGAYLSIMFDIEPVYIEGNFVCDEDYSGDDCDDILDELGESHCWLNVDGLIIDFTLAQFKENIIGFKNETFLIFNEDVDYKKYIELGESEIPKEYIKKASANLPFEEYLNAIQKANIESMFS